MSGKARAPIYIAMPIPTDENTSHKGFNIPGADYTDITRNIDDPDFVHLSVDISGMHVVSDASKKDTETGKRFVRLAIGTLSPGKNPVVKAQYLLDTKTSFEGQSAHPHPFFSPDTRMAFFNSDESGSPQVYMVTGYKFPEF